MRTSVLMGIFAAVLGGIGTPALGVHVSNDNFGQVVIFPYAVAGESLGRQTLIELRNADSQRHLVISFQIKHLAGRPLLNANVVIGPNGSFATALIGSDAGVKVARTAAGQCSTPDLSQSDTLLSYEFIEGPVSLESTQRFIVEAYSLGYIEPALAADCAAFQARYQPGGVWAPRNSDAFRNVDVTVPDNTLTGWATVIDSVQVTALNLRPLVLADFTDGAMNSAPTVATRPSLLDVSPAVSTRSVGRLAAGSGSVPAGQLVSSWAEPVHAVDALFMATEIEANISLGGTLSASSQVIAYYPTRAYHVDREFWGAGFQPDPFSDQSDAVNALAFDRGGEPLAVFSGAGDCGRNDASQLEITGFLLIALTGACGEGEAFVRVEGDTGTLVLPQAGTEIVSIEGHRYRGLPVLGHTLTTLRTRFENGVPLVRPLAYSWARPMPAKSAIAID